MSLKKALEKRFYEIFHHQIVVYSKRNKIPMERKWKLGDGVGFNRFKDVFFDKWVEMVNTDTDANISVNRIDTTKGFYENNMEVGVKVRNKVMRSCDPFLAKREGKKRVRRFTSMKEAEEVLGLNKNSVSRSINSGYPVDGWTFTWEDPVKEAEQVEIREQKRLRIVEKERARYYARAEVKACLAREEAKEKKEKAKVSKKAPKKATPKRIKAKVVSKRKPVKVKVVK